MARFTDKVVIITGAASGIGAGAARRFAGEGATLVLCDIDKAALDRLSEELGGGFETMEADISDRAACEALVLRAIDRFGRIDILVNDAGVDHLELLDEGDFGDFTQVIEKAIGHASGHGCSRFKPQDRAQGTDRGAAPIRYTGYNRRSFADA